MKKIIILLLIGSSFTFAALTKPGKSAKTEAKKAEAKIEVKREDKTEETQVADESDEENSKEPRAVWTFSYYEFSMLRQEQKEKFIKEFSIVAKENLFLNKMPELKSAKTLKETLNSESEWQKVEKQVNKYCQNINNTKECEKIATPRDEVLLEFRARK